MTINEVRAIYGHVKTTCNNLTIKYLKEIITPIVTDLGPKQRRKNTFFNFT